MLLKLENISKSFAIESKLLHRTIGFVKAVDNVSFELNSGEVVGLIGESGSGKTTLGKIIAGLIKPDEGKIVFNDILIDSKPKTTDVQMVFQDPFSSLNPKLSIGVIISEPVRQRHKINKTITTKRQIVEETKYLLALVGMPTNILDNYPHQFSGGQRQRIGIARVLAMQPKLIIADEPVSSLDISVQAQILNLLLDLRDKFNFAYLFISHDLSVINFISTRVLVMYHGAIIEHRMTEDIIKSPKNDYTKKLINSVPTINL